MVRAWLGRIHIRRCCHKLVGKNRKLTRYWLLFVYFVLWLIVPLQLMLLQDEVAGYFARYAQAMLKKIFNGSVSPGINRSAVDSPEHDCLSWLTPPGQLEGPNRDCTRPLR